MLVTGELWPSKRLLNDEEGQEVPGETPMENVEHLGQYVYEMTNAKVGQVRAERGLGDEPYVARRPDGDGDGDGDEEYAGVEEGYGY